MWYAAGCGRLLLAVAENFHTLVLTSVPQFTRAMIGKGPRGANEPESDTIPEPLGAAEAEMAEKGSRVDACSNARAQPPKIIDISGPVSILLEASAHRISEPLRPI